MSIQSALDFLGELKLNNNRSWFQEHKGAYDREAAGFEGFLTALIGDMAEFEPALISVQPKDCMYRIYRDIRFSKDKTPYDPSFRAHIAEGGRKAISAGLYVQLSPDDPFLGGGVHAVIPEVTRLVRDAIAAHDKEFHEIVTASDFPFTLEGEKLKNVPAGYDTGTLCAEYLKHKSWVVMDRLNGNDLKSYDTLRKAAVDFYKHVQPLYRFFHNALQGFVPPSIKK